METARVYEMQHQAADPAMTPVEIAQQIAERRFEIERLEAQMEEAAKVAIEHAVADVRALIVARGLDLEAVLDALRPTLDLGQKVRKAKQDDGAQQSTRKRTAWIDATGRQYKGGKPPNWMVDAMTGVGITSVKEFCAKHMVVKEAA
jgi:hypothetical protein